MITQKNNLNQYKEVNQKIKTVSSDIRDINDEIFDLEIKRANKLLSLDILIRERKEIKEANNLIKKSKTWIQ